MYRLLLKYQLDRLGRLRGGKVTGTHRANQPLRTLGSRGVPA